MTCVRAPDLLSVLPHRAVRQTSASLPLPAVRICRDVLSLGAGGPLCPGHAAVHALRCTLQREPLKLQRGVLL